MAPRRRKTAGKQFAVIGLGRFGRSVATSLFRMGHEVLAVDQDEAVINEVAEYVTHAVSLDATSEHAMRQLGIRNMDVAVVGIGGLQSSILATLVLKDLGIPKIVCKATSEAHGKVLEKLGADRIVFPERDMGHRVAHNLVSGNMIDYLELSSSHSIAELTVRADFVDRTIKNIDFRAKHGVNIVAVRRGDKVEVSPRADFKLAAGDILVIIGEDSKIDQLEG